MRSGAAADHRGYFHETAFYDSDEQFLATIVPFFTGGLEAGEPVVAAFAARNQALVRDVFGGDLRYIGGEAQYSRPAAAIRGYRELFGEYVAGGATQIRVAGDVPHPGVGVPWDWWARYEAAVNRAYDDFPVWGLCPYDVRTAPAEVVADVRRTHPQVATGTRHAANLAFEDPAAFLRTRSDRWRDPVERERPEVELVDPTSAQARAAVDSTAGSSDLSADDRNSLLIAVSEAVTNGLLHGRPPLVLRVWTQPRRVVVTVTDAGDGPADPYAGLLAARSGPGGRGLWIIHQLCSFAGLDRAAGEFTVRLVAGELN